MFKYIVAGMTELVFGTVTRTVEIFNLAALLQILRYLTLTEGKMSTEQLFYGIPTTYALVSVSMLIAGQLCVLFISCKTCLQIKALLLILCSALWAMLVGSLIHTKPPIFSEYTEIAIGSYLLLCLICLFASTVVRVYRHQNVE